MRPYITIITVVYNSVSNIEETILSVISQTYDKIQYVVIDGNSDDGTVEIIQRYQDSIDDILIEEDDGIFDAINKGIRLAKGDIIGVIHAGSKYTKNCLKYVAESYCKDNCIITGSAKGPGNRKDRIRSSMAKLGPKNPIVLHETLFIPTQILVNKGGYNTNYRYASDFDFISNVLTNKNIKVIYLDTILVEYLEDWGFTGGLRNKILKNKEFYKITKNYVGLRYAMTHTLIRYIKILLWKIFKK